MIKLRSNKFCSGNIVFIENTYVCKPTMNIKKINNSMNTMNLLMLVGLFLSFQRRFCYKSNVIVF